MSAYWAIVSARFRMLLQYRAAAAAGFATQLFWGLIRVMIFAAFYQAAKKPQPMSYDEVVTYIWLSQALLALLPWTLDREVAAMIRSGSVAYELLRPLDLYWTWYSRGIAMRVAPAVLRAMPMFVIAGLFLGLRSPASTASGLAWAAATVGALLLGCAITNLVTISMLWTISGDGANILLQVAAWVLSGMIVPLPLYPDWAQPVLNFLPFRGLLDAPFRLYMGHIPVRDAIYVFAHQAGWTAALILLGRWILSRGQRRLVVQGG